MIVMENNIDNSLTVKFKIEDVYLRMNQRKSINKTIIISIT